MKKRHFITAFAILLVSGVGFAQDIDAGNSESPTQKGKLFVGATSNAGLNFGTSSFEFGESEETEKDKRNSFGIQPTIGYFIIDNLVGGAQVSIQSSKFTDGDTDTESKSSSLAAGPFLRYYFDTGNVKPYIGGSALFGSTRTESNFFTIGDFDPVITNREDKSGLTAWSINAGAAVFLNKSIAVDLDLGYSGSTTKDKENDFKTKNGNFGLNIGFSLYL